MSVSRDSILAIIRRNDGASVDVLADEVVLAPATVRRHLDILERDGLIDHIEVRRPTGRPLHVFDLSENGHDSVPKDYSRLLNELVQDIKNIAASVFTVPKACVPRPNCRTTDVNNDPSVLAIRSEMRGSLYFYKQYFDQNEWP